MLTMNVTQDENLIALFERRSRKQCQDSKYTNVALPDSLLWLWMIKVSMVEQTHLLVYTTRIRTLDCACPRIIF